MKTIDTKTTDSLADLEAVIQHLRDKTPVEPELARRVEERSDRTIEQLRQHQIHFDIDQLLHDAREEA